MRRGASIVVLMGALAMFFVGHPSSASASEDELLRQIKDLVFEQKWDAVLTTCDQFIASFQRSTALPRAYYYKAQGLEHIKGREADAITAYGDFLKKFPGSTGTLNEDATLSRITLATSLYLKGDKGHVPVLMDGMDLKGYPRIYAAIQSSKIDHAAARQKAIPLLKDCASEEPDDELRNECVIALLRVKPGAIPSDPVAPRPIPPPPPRSAASPRDGISPPTPPREPNPASPAAPRAPREPNPATPREPATPASPTDAKMIRVEVLNLATGKVKVRVNMPLAFAELAVQSLEDEYGEVLKHELKQKGLGIKFETFEQFFNAIKKGGKQTLVEIENEGESIKVWIE